MDRAGQQRRALVAGLLSLVACSAEDPSKINPVRAAGGSGASMSMAPARGGRTGAGAGGLFTDNPMAIPEAGGNAAAGGSSAGSGAVTANSDLPSCVQTASEAERVPVDMYIMLDRSSSMLGETGAGPSKWDAIRDALNAFIEDDRSAGLGVGLQYFPLGKAGVPTTCVADSDCGEAGPCLIRACQPPPTGDIPLILCISDEECPTGSPGCAAVGTCQRNASVYCFDIGAGGCGPRDGACIGVQSECFGFASCLPDDYATPAVPIGVLPSNARQLSAALAATMPLGLTPTSAALTGALGRAKAQAQAEPSHRVIAVLATDGTPTECDPTDTESIGRLAGKALAETPSVRTYVIGVFNEMETEARTNLKAWSVAGGTSDAFIIDPGQDVAVQFLDALELIRSGSVACEYLLPPTPLGSTLDLDRVNVALVENGISRDFLYVGDGDHCDRAELGWHYDAPPATGGATKFVVCSAACDVLQAPGNRRVEVRVGCKTMGPD